MARNGRSRLFKRGTRYWGDFRALGGKREPLIPPGEMLATTDRRVAETVLADRVRELEHRRVNKVLLGVEELVGLQEYASRHLDLKKKSGRFTDRSIAQLETQLARGCEYFGPHRELSTITVSDVQAFTQWLQERPNGRSGTLSPGTVRHHLNALSNLYVRAAGERRVPSGHNPVRDMMDKPVGRAQEARWLEVHDAALLLEAARRYQVPEERKDHIPFMYPLLATFLLTGGRTMEVLGLEVSDVSFDGRRVTFRPNEHRRIKTKAGNRGVPLWPQLEEILRVHVFGGVGPSSGGLLFPSPRTGKLLSDVRKALDAVAESAGWTAGEIRAKMFRHTYCAARLQTLDHGVPVSPFTVSREMGHGGTGLVERIYGHVSDVRQRGEVVEYRVENHREVLGDRLAALPRV